MPFHVPVLGAWKVASSSDNGKALSTCSAPVEAPPYRLASALPPAEQGMALAGLQWTPSHVWRLPDPLCPGSVPSQEPEAGEWLKSSGDLRQLNRKTMTPDLLNIEKSPCARKIMKLLMKWDTVPRQKPHMWIWFMHLKGLESRISVG